MNIAALAGAVSTLFAVSYLPMLAKAVRGKDLGSCSFAKLALSNVHDRRGVRQLAITRGHITEQEVAS
jgi:hypothetical protein